VRQRGEFARGPPSDLRGDQPKKRLDPLRTAAEIAGWDLDKVWRGEWERHQLTPSDILARLTPTEFVALFVPPRPKAALDPLAELIRTNAERGRKGLKPVFPAWYTNG
jgi:hypothetical protein